MQEKGGADFCFTEHQSSYRSSLLNTIAFLHKCNHSTVETGVIALLGICIITFLVFEVARRPKWHPYRGYHIFL